MGSDININIARPSHLPDMYDVANVHCQAIISPHSLD